MQVVPDSEVWYKARNLELTPGDKIILRNFHLILKQAFAITLRVSPLVLIPGFVPSKP